MREVKAVLQPLWEVWQSSCWSWIFRRTHHKWAAIRSKEHNLGPEQRLLHVSCQLSSHSDNRAPVTTGNSGLSGPGLGQVIPLTPLSVLSGTKWNLKLSVQGEHLRADVSAGQFGCKHPAQR